MSQRRFFLAVRHPLERAESSTPPQLPLEDKTPGNTKLGGMISKEPLSSYVPGEKCSGLGVASAFIGCTKARGTQIIRATRLQGQIPRGNRLQGQRNKIKDKPQSPRVWSKRQQKQQQRQRQRRRPTSKGEANDNNNKNDNDNNKEDAQPPRVRRTRQDSPQECNFLFFHQNTLRFNIV